VRRLDRQITTAGQAIRTPVRENGITLTEVYETARCWLPSWWATLATSAGSPDRDHLASYTGTAPVGPPAGMSAGSG
jgi:hypothetical protein